MKCQKTPSFRLHILLRSHADKIDITKSILIIFILRMVIYDLSLFQKYENHMHSRWFHEKLSTDFKYFSQIIFIQFQGNLFDFLNKLSKINFFLKWWNLKNNGMLSPSKITKTRLLRNDIFKEKKMWRAFFV